MDVIADWLSAARVTGTLFSRSELTEAWGLRYPAAPRIAFHILSRGRAYLRRPGTAAPPTALGQGDVVLLTSGEAHELASSPGAPAIDLLAQLAAQPLGADRTIRLGGGGAMTVMLCGAYGLDAANAGPLMSLLPPVVHLPAGEQEGTAVHATLQLLLAETAAASGPSVVSRLVDVLLIYVLRAWSRGGVGAAATGWLRALHDPCLACALARVHDEPAREWTVEAMAEEAGLSRSAFARRFTATVGEAPLAYLTRWRLTLAARILADGDAPLAAVAERVGYRSEFAFNRAFARHHGVAPGRWRARA